MGFIDFFVFFNINPTFASRQLVQKTRTTLEQATEKFQKNEWKANENKCNFNGSDGLFFNIYAE